MRRFSCRFLLSCFLFFCAHARAATYTVTSTADPGDGVCDVSGSGDGCTLRDAIIAANAEIGADTIVFDAGVFATARDIVLVSALPHLTDELKIAGPQSMTVKIWAFSDLLFVVDSGVKATFNNLRLKGKLFNSGTVGAINCVFFETDQGIENSGGAMTLVNCRTTDITIGIVNTNSATLSASNCNFSKSNQLIRNVGSVLTLSNCVLSDNTTGIANSDSGTVTAMDCVLRDNTVGITNTNSGTVTATRCTISGTTTGIRNASSSAITLTGCILRDNGGGIENSSTVIATNCTSDQSGIGNASPGVITVTNCTLNNANAGIANGGTANVTNCTMTGNGYGLTGSGTATVNNSLLVGNSVKNIDLTFTGSHNILSGTPAQAGLEVDGSGNPILKDNGGPTPTVALVSSAGKAVNTGDSALVPAGVTTDQRGPGYARIKGGIVDIGAYESDFSSSSLSVSDAASNKEGSASVPGSATFAVKLSASSNLSVTVNYTTTDGVTNGAQAGSDYIAKCGTLTFAPGETTKYVKVTFIGDEVTEQSEPFYLDIKTSLNATIVDHRGSTYIKNDDGPSITIENAPTVTEGNSGTRLQVFTVHLSAPSADKVTVDWATANGTAGPADFIAASGTLTFAPGMTSKIIVVQIKGDTLVEPTEYYRVNLSSPQYAVLADSEAAGFIGNDDTAPPLFEDAPSE